MVEPVFALQTEEIRDADGLKGLEAEWTSLWQRCPQATPFQHPTWLISWWRHFAAGKQLLTVALRDRNTLVGMTPFCILHDVEGRKVMPVGIGLSDHLDALVAPHYEEPAAIEIFRYLAQQASNWDICDLQPLLAESPLLNVTAPDGITSEVKPVDTLTLLELPSDCGAFRQRLSRHFCDRLNEATRRAEKLGPLDFELATRRSFDRTFDYLLRFHQARWNSDSNSSALSHDPAALFQREAASAMLDRGSLRLYSLSISSRIVAVLYGFVHHSQGYFYMMGFDSHFAKISPGVLLMTHAIEELIREGLTECHFLRGREAYKYRWRVIEQKTYARRLSHH